MFKYAVIERSKIIGTDVSENVKYKIELDPLVLYNKYIVKINRYIIAQLFTTNSYLYRDKY